MLLHLTDKNSLKINKVNILQQNYFADKCLCTIQRYVSFLSCLLPLSSQQSNGLCQFFSFSLLPSLTRSCLLFQFLSPIRQLQKHDYNN